MAKPMTWGDLLAAAKRLTPEQLSADVYVLGDSEDYGPIYAVEPADEDWVDDESGEGPILRSTWEWAADEDDDDPRVVVRAGDPILWTTPPAAAKALP